MSGTAKARDPTRESFGGRAEATRGQFLNAAERAFALRGYEGATIRSIAEACGVNLGALHYYWGSKQALLREVCERRFRRMHEERLRRLEAVAAGPLLERDDAVRALLRAALEPLFELEGDEEQQAMVRLLHGRILTDPSPAMIEVRMEIYEAVSRRFLTLLRLACDHLSEREFSWRVDGVVGAFVFVSAGMAPYERQRQRAAEAGELGGVDLLVNFLAAGLLAPALDPPTAG